MPIALFLSEEQMNVVNTAVKGKNIEFKTHGRSTIQLTAENWEQIRDAVSALHDQKFKIRTKTIDHLEICYCCEQVIKKIGHLETDLRNLPPSNDNKIGLIKTEEPDAEDTASLATNNGPTIAPNALSGEGSVQESDSENESESKEAKGSGVTNAPNRK